LARETHHIFAAWRFDDPPAINLARGTEGHFGTRGWEEVVRSSVGVRVRDLDRAAPLIRLAQGAIAFEDWLACLRLWMFSTEEPFGTFVREWLFGELAEGRGRVVVSDVRSFVDVAWERAGKARPTEDGRIRAARDLLKTSTDLGLLRPGSSTRDIASPGMGDDALMFHAHMIAAFEGSAGRVVDSPYWRSALMRPEDVHAAFLRLHQYRRLDYQVAGSLVELSLPHADAMACAEAAVS
jgi:hypothetical protein